MTSLIIFQLLKIIISFAKNGSKRAERVENRVLGGVVVSASDIIEHCPHQIAIGANRPETSGTVTDFLPVSRVPHGSCYLLSLSRKQVKFI